jgi:hypothetical protein
MTIDTQNNYQIEGGDTAKLAGKYLVIFLLWPFLAFITALFNYRQNVAKNVVYIFLVYYGFNFFLGNIGADGEVYLRRMINFSEMPFTDFFYIVGGLYSDTSVDIVEPLISFIVSRFTNQHHLLFAAYAAFFSFFYLKSINLLYNKQTDNPGVNSIIFLAFFVMVLPVSSINGFRMWTATWVFFLGAYHVILFRDYRYLLLTLGAALVHFSFLSVNMILFAYLLAGNRNVIYIPLAGLSFFIPGLVAPYFQIIASKFGGSLETRYSMYSSEEYVMSRHEAVENAIWYVRFGHDLVFYFLIFAIAYIAFITRKEQQDKMFKNLFSFNLVILAFVNFGKQIPSFGGRFQVVFILFATLYVFLYFIKHENQHMNYLTWLGSFPMLVYVALQFRNASDTINAWLLSPGFGLHYFVTPFSLSELLF